MRKLPPSVADPAPLFEHGGRLAVDRQPAADFSVNVNPLGPPSSVLDAIRNRLDVVARYPDPACDDLVRQLAARHGVHPAHVVAGNGSNELIHAVPRAFRPRRVAVVEPTYTEYLRASLLAGAEMTHWLADGPAFEPRPFDPERADAVWLCHPNNPTGRLWPRETLAAWVADYPRTLFVVDEAFLPFRHDEAEHSLVSAAARRDNLIVLRSLTKVYTLPGLRLGYAVTSAARARRLRDHLGPWTVNALAQVAGVAALADEAFLARTHDWLGSTMPSFVEQLRAVPALRPLPSSANFVLVRLREGSAVELAVLLAQRGFVIRDCSNFVGLDGRYVRLAVRTAAENAGLVEALRLVSGEW
jgi:threonine-phosphate decarboxylase